MDPLINGEGRGIVPERDAEYFGGAILIGEHERLADVALMPGRERHAMLKDLVDQVELFITGDKFFAAHEDGMCGLVECDEHWGLVRVFL